MQIQNSAGLVYDLFEDRMREIPHDGPFSTDNPYWATREAVARVFQEGVKSLPYSIGPVDVSNMLALVSFDNESIKIGCQIFKQENFMRLREWALSHDLTKSTLWSKLKRLFQGDV